MIASCDSIDLAKASIRFTLDITAEIVQFCLRIYPVISPFQLFYRKSVDSKEVKKRICNIKVFSLKFLESCNF